MNRELKLAPSQSGLAYTVGRLQEHLYNHAVWLEKVFGLAADEYRKNDEKLTLVVPQAYDKDSRYTDVLPNNKWVSHAFFYQDGPETTLDYQPHASSKMECNISLIVWVDLEKVKKEMGYTFSHRYIDELLDNIKGVLRQFGDFKVDLIERRPKEVWKNWTIGRGIGFFGDVSEYADTQIGRHPEAGFRIKGTLYYRDRCGELAIPLPPASGTAGHATVVINGQAYTVNTGSTLTFSSDFEITPDFEITIQ